MLAMAQPSKQDRSQLLEGYVQQAGRKIFDARECQKQSRHADAVQDCQEAIELLAKCVFLVRDRPFPKDHAIPEADFQSALLGLPDDTRFLNLPRLYVLHLFWAEFYEKAKYGLETLAVPAQDLFTHAESDLALGHAGEWQRAIGRLKIMVTES